MRIIALIGLTTLTIICSAQQSEKAIRGIDISDTRIVTVNDEGEVQVFDRGSMQRLYQKKLKSDQSFSGAAFSYDGEYLIIENLFSNQILKAENGRSLKHLDAGYGEVMETLISPFENQIFTYGDLSLNWDIKTGKNFLLEGEWMNGAGFGSENELYTLNDGVLSKLTRSEKIGFTKAGEVSLEEDLYSVLPVIEAEILALYSVETLEVRDVDRLELLYKYKIGNIYNVLLGGIDGANLIIISVGYKTDFTFKKLNLENGEIESSAAFPELDFGWDKDIMRAIPETNLFVIGHPDGQVNVFDIETMSLSKELEKQQSQITAISISPDGKILAVGTEQGVLKMWDTMTWEIVKTVQ